MSQVSFAELSPEHTEQIKENILKNNLDASRADIRTSDLFESFAEDQWNLIVCNPPYIPRDRKLESSVTDFEPREALFSGPDGMELIRRIVAELSRHLLPRGQVWMECDVSNIAETSALLTTTGCSVEIRNDQYGRPRVVVGYFL
jgi:release factor glutamine methyltransferase